MVLVFNRNKKHKLFGNNGHTETREYQTRLGLLGDIAEEASSITQVSVLLERILKVTERTVDSSITSVFLKDETRSRFHLPITVSKYEDTTRSKAAVIESEIADLVAGSATPVLSNNVATDTRFNLESQKTADSIVRSIIAAPILKGENVIGVLMAANKDSGGFTQRDFEVLKGFASTEAIILLASLEKTAIDNANDLTLNENLLEGHRDTAHEMASTIDVKEDNVYTHARRTKEYALLAASSLPLQPRELQAIELGALLHDIGKIGIDDRILCKPGPLTDEEWKIIREHPQKGADILKDIPHLKDATNIVLYHHERYDGTGYPKMLKGDEIPIGARLVAVANAFDTMTTDNPYRAALSLDDAMKELIHGTGTQFCPKAVEAFISAYKKHQGNLPEKESTEVIKTKEDKPTENQVIMVDKGSKDTKNLIIQVKKDAKEARKLKIKAEKAAKEAREKAEKEAKEAKAKAEREAREAQIQKIKAEKEAKEARIKAEREAKEARIKAEREAREAQIQKIKADKEAREAKIQAEKEAKEARIKAEREAKEARIKAEREAREAQILKIKADREAREARIKAEKEAKEKAEKEAREAQILRIKAEKEAREARIKAEKEAKEAKAKAEKEAREAQILKIKAEKEAREAQILRIKADKEAKEAKIQAEKEAKEKAEKEAWEAQIQKIKADKEAIEAKIQAEKEAKEARIKAEREVKEAKEKAEKEAREAQIQKIKTEKEAREAKIKAEKEAKEARIKAEREAREAQILKIKADKEAKEARIKAEKEAKEKAEKEAREAQILRIKAEKEAREAKRKIQEETKKTEKAKQQPKYDSAKMDAEVCKGNVRLAVPITTPNEEVKAFGRELEKIQGVKILMLSHCEEEGHLFLLALQKPITLTRFIREIPQVETINKKGSEISVVLRDNAS
jgi:putative nucleotidyltransferase with HDIG domain